MISPGKPRPAAKEPLRRRSIYLLPNLFTTLALFAGFYAIVQAMNNRFELAAMAIFVATLGVMTAVSARAAGAIAAPDRTVLASIGDLAAEGPRTSGGWLDYRLYAVGLLAALGALLASLA